MTTDERDLEPTMTCEDVLASLDDVIDDRIDPAVRPAVEAHLTGCQDCRLMATDLRQIRETAGALERHRPPDRVWSALAARLEADARGSRPARRAGLPPRTWLAMAATLLVGVIGAVWFLQRLEPVPTTTGNGSAADLVESIEAELRVAEEHYTRAIAGLEQIAQADEDALDPDTAATLRANLALIDRAIADSRGALREHPESGLARNSLFEALRRKVSLLQETVALINEMRKGDEIGAARAAAGLNKS